MRNSFAYQIDEQLDNIVEQSPTKASLKAINWLFVTPVLCFVIAGFDIIYSFGLKESLPIVPESILWFNLLFNFPHIVGSTLILTEPSYANFYWRKLLITFVLFSIAVFILPKLVGKSWFSVIAMAWTVKHVIGQQYTIALYYVKGKPTKTFHLWKWIGILTGGIIFVGIYKMYFFKYMTVPQRILFESSLHISLISFVILLTAASVLFGIKKNKETKNYILLNLILMYASSYLLYMEYYCLAILGPRVIHDMTAFTFYGVHNVNKKNTDSLRGIFSIIHHNKFNGLPTTILTSTIISFPIMAFSFYVKNWSYYYIFAAMHFYFESSIWKKGSPLREYIFIKK